MYFESAAACDPTGDYSGPRALVAALAEAAPEAEWLLGTSGGSASAVRLGLLACRNMDAARAAAARVLALDPAAHEVPAAAARARPWLDAAWDAESGAWTGVELARAAKSGDVLRALLPGSGPERPLHRRTFSAARFDEPVASALRQFHAQEPVAEIQEAGGPGWTLVLARPVAWPLFLRCDLAAAFVPRAAGLSLLLRDARVAALEFDGDALWARLIG
jgi:hypothetical protein